MFPGDFPHIIEENFPICYSHLDTVLFTLHLLTSVRSEAKLGEWVHCLCIDGNAHLDSALWWLYIYGRGYTVLIAINQTFLIIKSWLSLTHLVKNKIPYSFHTFGIKVRYYSNYSVISQLFGTDILCALL